MQHTNDEIERASRRFEELADRLDPDTAEVDRTDDLRQVAAISEALRTDEAQLRESVNIARAREVLEPDRTGLGRIPPGGTTTIR